MLPVYAANMAAAFAPKFPGTPRAISVRWLGAHKTWRGCALALMAATITVALQAWVGWQGQLIDYDDPLVLGVLCGAAAMAGDAAKSFVKRRLHIAPGEPWIVADQLDYVVAGLLVLGTRYSFSAVEAGVVVVISFVGTMFVNLLSAAMGIKDNPW